MCELPCVAVCKCLMDSEQPSKDYHLSPLPMSSKHTGISSERKDEGKHLEPDHYDFH